MNSNDILIIGAGPSGLFAAAELARHGVTARILERERHPHRQARATAIQPGTLEILESVGLLAPILAASERIHHSRLYGPGMRELGGLSLDGIDCCCRFQCSLPQYETERILASHLSALGVTVERGVAATSVTAGAEGLRVVLSHSDGREETVEPAFVIGAGGAHSITRHSMGELMEGATYEGHFLVADIAMPGPFAPGEAGVICGPRGFLLLAPLPHGRWISFQDLEEDVESVTAADVVARVHARLGGSHRPTDVGWSSPFRMHRRMVSRLADGRRFLIGDAAHQSSPFGGEGLNAGLQDGYDLAWKLALVCRGLARPSLLEAYAVERRIADRHVLEVSDQVHRSIAGAADAARKQQEMLPSSADPVTSALLCNARAMLDINYSGSPLVVDHAPDPRAVPGPHPGQRYADRLQFSGAFHHALIFGAAPEAEVLRHLNQRWSRQVRQIPNPAVDPARAGVPSGGVVLIRPDGHIGFRFPATHAEALTQLDDHLASYLVPDPDAG